MLITIEKIQEEITKKYIIPTRYRDDVMQDIALIITKDGPNNINVESIMNELMNKYSESKPVFKVKHINSTIAEDICSAFSILNIHEEFTIRMKYGFNTNNIIYHNAYIAHYLHCSMLEVEQYEKSALMKLRKNIKLLHYFQDLDK